MESAIGGQHGAAPGHARADVLGIGVHALDMERAVVAIEQAVAKRARAYVCVTGMHGVMEAQRDPGLRETLNRAYLNVPDGMPTVWVGKLQGHRGMRRVFGPDLMAEVCRVSAERGYRQFFYGGGPGVADELAAALQARFPRLIVCGSETPPFRPLEPREAAALHARVRANRPDILWVGLSTPKQERFMAEQSANLDVGVVIGVGAAFDYHTGRLRDAPDWIKNSGLQWAHRIWQEPRRLWRRYAYNIPAFVFLLVLQLAGFRRSGGQRWTGEGDRAGGTWPTGVHGCDEKGVADE
jgi:N-acetylglucosaminyldiphosphoundecaprenol N-acetyl-beta-D-mannosaminyltransferase